MEHSPLVTITQDEEGKLRVHQQVFRHINSQTAW